jgi:hypothetical protein
LPKNSKSGAKRPVQSASPVPSKRDRRNKIVAIWIILSLIFSLLVGALSITPTPAGAITLKSVQISAADQEVIDTDSDGIENNADPDVDGDGIVNGEDPDIDGDGIANFDDADPIDTTNIDSNAPQKPIRPAGQGDMAIQSMGWIWTGGILVLTLAISAWILAKRRKK